MLNYQKYKRVPVMTYPEREWPNKEIEKAPIWCSVDLRDGNQALIDPMVVGEKIEFFQYLVNMGFKEIEVGFPAASQIEYDFLRQLIDRRLIPDDVRVQVLTQCREELIDRTFEAIEGCKQAIVHIYNSTSTLQRDVVFNMDRDQITEIAVKGTQMVKERAAKFGGKIILEYSPESFTGTEMDFAVEICNAVIDIWQPTPEDKVIINLPATVEMSMPHVYAQQIEYMHKHLHDRENVIISIHPHNDRGCAVADSEMGKEKLQAAGEKILASFKEMGMEVGDTRYVNAYAQGRKDWNMLTFSEQNVDNNNETVAAKQLYRIAKTFLKGMRDFT